MFLVSLVRFPLNNFLTQVALSGEITYFSYLLVYLIPALTAGIFEESARYVGFKKLINDSSYRTGITYGIGHGGMESIFLVGFNILSIGVLLIVNPSSVPVMQQYANSIPLYLPLVGAYERIMVLIIQISLSIMVVESIRVKQIKYFVLAVFMHVAVDYLSLSATSYGMIFAEFVVTLFAIMLGEWAYSKIKNNIMV